MSATDMSAAAAETTLALAPLVRSVRLSWSDPQHRPWGLVWPDEPALLAGGFVNWHEAIRFRVENQASRLPVSLRPRALAIVRDDCSPNDRHAIERMARDLVHERLRAVPQQRRAGERLPAVWDRLLRPMLGSRAANRALDSATSLEFDLEFDSLERAAFLFTLASVVGDQAIDEARLQGCLTLGDVCSCFASAPPIEMPPRELDPRALFHYRPGKPPRHFRRPATLSWPIVWGVRRLGHAMARRRLDLEVMGVDRVDWSLSPLMVAQNHQSHLDPPLLASAFPARVHRRAMFLGFDGYFGAGAGRLASRLFRVHPFSADRAMVAGLRAARWGIESGMVLGIYPEGERSWDGTLRPFKRGVAWLAREAGAWVVPSAIVGAYQAWPRSWKFHPHPVRIAFGTPLKGPSRDGGVAEEEAFLRELRVRIEALMRELGADPDRGVPEVWEHGPAAPNSSNESPL